MVSADMQAHVQQSMTVLCMRATREAAYRHHSHDCLNVMYNGHTGAIFGTIMPASACRAGAQKAAQVLSICPVQFI